MANTKRCVSALRSRPDTDNEAVDRSKAPASVPNAYVTPDEPLTFKLTCVPTGMFRAWTTTGIGSLSPRGRTTSTVPGRTPAFDRTGKPPIETIVRAAVVEVGMIVGLMVERTAEGIELPLYRSCPG